MLYTLAALIVKYSFKILIFSHINLKQTNKQNLTFPLCEKEAVGEEKKLDYQSSHWEVLECGLRKSKQERW